jgi:hypothetical protein
MRTLNAEQFERLKTGDLVRVESTADVLMVIWGRVTTKSEMSSGGRKFPRLSGDGAR